MQSVLTCAHPFFPPSSVRLSLQKLRTDNYLQINQDGHHLKSTCASKFQTRTKSALFFHNLYLQLYVNAGAMCQAQNLFDEMPDRTLISWTILMSGYARHGPCCETLRMFTEMLSKYGGGELVRPDSFVYAVALRVCGMVENLCFGQGIHGHVLKSGLAVDGFVENALLNMYSSCGSLGDAVVIFYGIKLPDLVARTSILSGYVKNGLEEEALRIFLGMAWDEIELDAFVYSMSLKACASLEFLDFGTQIHCRIIKTGFDCCLYLENSLMDFYAKCGDLEGMSRVFEYMSEKDLVSWNTIITGYIHNFHYSEAIRTFKLLTNTMTHFDDFTVVNILKVITSLSDLDNGRQVHGYILRTGLESNLHVISALLEMYSECASHERLDQWKEIPLKLYVTLEGGACDEFVLARMLKWCSLQSDLETGKVFHSLIIKLNLNSEPYIVCSLIDMYSKCGFLEAALCVFQRVKEAGTTTWSALISGFARNGWFKEALRLSQKMHFDGFNDNEFTFTSILLACLAVRDLRKGKEVHCRILRTGYDSNVSVLKMLIYLYSEMWHHKQALKLCSLIPIVEMSWNLLIKACLKAGDYRMIHEVLRTIQLSRGYIDPRSVCDILSSCATPVLLNVATQAQAYMTKRGLMSHPTTGNCLIEMYSGCGKIKDAVLAFNSMPENNSLTWTSLLTAYIVHGHPWEALDLFRDMQWKKKSMDPVTFKSVLKACAQLGQVDEAYHLFSSMEEVYGIEPSEEHYSCMVEALGHAEMFEEVSEFIEMINPVNLGSIIWRTLLSSCRIHGHMPLAKFALEKLLELDPSDCSTHLLLEQVLLMLGKWDNATKTKIKREFKRANSSWIEIKNKIYEFVSNQNPTNEVSNKLAEIQGMMEELGYVADRNHLLHNAEEEEYKGNGFYHTEMKAVAFGLISQPRGVPVRVVKSVRVCGDCHSALKFMSTFLDQELVVKDPCSFHHFRNGKCSCRDTW